MTRPRTFALLLAATAMSTLWAGPAQAADPPASSLVLQTAPPGYTRTPSPESNGPLDLEKAVAFLGNDDETRKDLRADKFSGGHVSTFAKGQTALLSAVFVFEKEIPGDEFVKDAKEGLNEGDTKATEFDTGLPDAIGVSTGTGQEQTHVVLFAKRHHAFLDVLAGPEGSQQQLLAIAKAHHASLNQLEPAVEDGIGAQLGRRLGGVAAVAVLGSVLAVAVAKFRGRKAAPATAAAWDANAPTWGAPPVEGGEQQQPWDGDQPPPPPSPSPQQQ